MTRTTMGPVIDRAKENGGAALIGFLTAGYPSLRGSIDAAKAAIAGGMDAIELGLPYSDPGMDGPVIQRAGQLALARGFRTSQILQAVEELAETGAGIMSMTYWNPILQYGVDAFARDFANAGGAGLITPDLLPDDADDWIAASDEHGLDRIFLVAPSSRPDRLALTSSASRGFVYAASTMGVTGARGEVDVRAKELVERTRQAGAERVCVGLGVSSAEQASDIASYADGVIVGSALIRSLGDDGTNLAGAEAFAADLARGAHHPEVP